MGRSDHVGQVKEGRVDIRRFLAKGVQPCAAKFARDQRLFERGFIDLKQTRG